MRHAPLARHTPLRLLVVLLCAGLLVGCATPSPPTPIPEPVKIYFAFPDDLDDYYDDLIEQFNDQHPYITVERRTAGNERTWRYLFEKGEIDTFIVSGEDVTIAALREEEAILDLAPLIQVNDFDLDDYYPSTLDPFQFDGSTWALPAGVNVAVLYYNQEMFDENALPYPQANWTWDDMLRAAVELRDPDGSVYGLAAYPFFSIPMVYQHGGQIMDDWQTPTRLTMDDPLTIEAIEWFVGLSTDYDVMPSPRTANELFGQAGNAPFMFWRRRAAMYMGFLSDRGGETWGPGARWPMAWGMAPLPHDETSATIGLVHAHGITWDTEHPDACWEWITFLDQQMPPFTIPARRSLAESDAYRERVGPETADVALASIEYAMVIDGSQEGVSFDIESYMEAINNMLNGDVLVTEALSELQRASEAGQ